VTPGGNEAGARPRRLFVAVEVPPAACRAVEEAVEPWRTAFPRARWVSRERWHVTLKFLGPVSPAGLEQVSRAVAEVAATTAPFTTSLASLGAFPSTRRARVLWAGLDDPEGGMGDLARALDASLSPAFPREHRAFHPHLTVARCDPPLALPAGFTATQIEAAPFRIERVVVVESITGPRPRYEPVAAADLDG
jgi:2'-5' RNA ligase